MEVTHEITIDPIQIIIFYTFKNTFCQYLGVPSSTIANIWTSSSVSSIMTEKLQVYFEKPILLEQITSKGKTIIVKRFKYIYFCGNNNEKNCSPIVVIIQKINANNF